MRDHRVGAGVEGIEHPRPGLVGVAPDREDGREAGGVEAVAELRDRPLEAHRQQRHVLGDQGVLATVFGAVKAGADRAVKAEQASVADLEPLRPDPEAGFEDGDDLAQLAQAFGGVAVQKPPCGLGEQRNLERHALVAHHRQHQHELAQVAARQMAAPGRFHVMREAVAIDRLQPERGGAHQPVDIEGEPIIEAVQDGREVLGEVENVAVRRRDPVDALDFEAHHQRVVAGADGVIVHFERIGHFRIELRRLRYTGLRALADRTDLGVKHSDGPPFASCGSERAGSCSGPPQPPCGRWG